jgi:hypothetical protein
MRHPRRITIDVEVTDEEYDHLFSMACTVAEIYADNFDVSGGPSPDDACYPHPLESERSADG